MSKSPSFSSLTFSFCGASWPAKIVAGKSTFFLHFFSCRLCPRVWNIFALDEYWNTDVCRNCSSLLDEYWKLCRCSYWSQSVIPFNNHFLMGIIDRLQYLHQHKFQCSSNRLQQYLASLCKMFGSSIQFFKRLRIGLMIRRFCHSDVKITIVLFDLIFLWRIVAG